MDETYTGKVKFFKEDRGFGFISPDKSNCNNGDDVFVHVRDLNESNSLVLEEGQKVIFELGEHNGKTKASNVKIIS